MSAVVAIAVGLPLPNGEWMPVATLVVMKPSLQQSTLVAEQRVAGTIIGAPSFRWRIPSATGQQGGPHGLIAWLARSQ